MDESSVDFGVPWHFGDPLREQRTWVGGAGRVDLSHLITHTVTLDEYERGLELLEGSKDCGKVMVLVGEDA